MNLLPARPLLRDTTGSLASALAVMVLGLIPPAFNVHAQDQEPRAYVNTPVGMNFLLVGYQYSEGALLFDPAIPVTDANAKVDMGVFGFVHALGIADKSANIGVLLPVARLDADGYVDGVFRTREDNGLTAIVPLVRVVLLTVTESLVIARQTRS